MTPEGIATLSAFISAVALIVSFATYWSNNLKTGQILMTKPTIFFFGWDVGEHPRPKVFMRCLLFASSNSGRVLERLYLKVVGPGGAVLYSFWGHTNGQPNSLMKGSGLFISKEGFLADHHFNSDPSTEVEQPYCAGSYEIEVIGRQFGDSVDRKLGRYCLTLDDSFNEVLAQKKDGVLWSLNPQDNKYYSEVQRKSLGISIPRDRAPRSHYFESISK